MKNIKTLEIKRELREGCGIFLLDIRASREGRGVLLGDLTYRVNSINVNRLGVDREGKTVIYVPFEYRGCSIVIRNAKAVI